MNLLRSFAVLSVLIVVVGIITSVEVHFIKLPTVDITTRFLLIGLLTVNVIALLTLMFFVGKNVFRLYSESRQGLLGHKFQIKLVSIFVIMLLLPSTLLFVVSSGLATDYINRIFSPQMKEPFIRSVELARQFYDYERARTLEAAEQVARGNMGAASSKNVHHFSAPPSGASDVIKDAFQGKRGTEILTLNDGDLIRAAVPADGGSVIVVERKLPKAISDESERIRNLFEEHSKLESLKVPLRSTYVMILGFITLLMIFAGIWIAMKLSRGITMPIQKLAEATQEVGQGNLGVAVEEKSEDEIGLLITSFNDMVRQLRGNKEQLERAISDLQKRELFLSNILQNINSGVLVLNTRGRIQTVNAQAREILNVRADDIEGKNYQDLIAQLGSPDLEAMASALVRGRVPDTVREARIHVQGKALTLRVFVTAIRDPETETAIGFLIVFDDLTDVIKAQKALAWQEIARRITHEIKNPLTPIKLSAERLMKKWQQKDADFDVVFERSTKTIITEVESLRHLVDVFTKYGKMPEIVREQTNVAELVESAVSLFRSFRDLKIDVSVPPEPPIVSIDRQQCKRVLINIMDNAVRAMQNKGRLAIMAVVRNNTLVIEITDSGPGIPNHEKEQLFLPYFSQRKDGTGLGLAIADKIIKEHGGRITIRDNDPQGSIFCIEIPLQFDRETVQRG